MMVVLWLVLVLLLEPRLVPVLRLMPLMLLVLVLEMQAFPAPCWVVAQAALVGSILMPQFVSAGLLPLEGSQTQAALLRMPARLLAAYRQASVEVGRPHKVPAAAAAPAARGLWWWISDRLLQVPSFGPWWIWSVVWPVVDREEWVGRGLARVGRGLWWMLDRLVQVLRVGL